MQLKVRDVLELLQKTSLVRICKHYELAKYGNKEQLIRRLIDRYWGDLSALINDLKRNELETIADDLSSRMEFPRSLNRMTVVELKKLLISATTATAEEKREGIETHKVELFCSSDFMDHDGGQIHRFDAKTLSNEAVSADRVTVVSAYYSDTGLTQILQNCKGKKRVVLNGFGGRRLEKQVKELEDLNWELDAEIRLGFAAGIFHTKLYLFEFDNQSRQSAVAWVGSANATDAGMSGHNEEVLVRIEPAPESVLEYADQAWRRGQDLSQFHPRVNSVDAFLRTGTLYYKPYTLLQKTINPFKSLMNRLPREEKEKLPQTFESDYSDEELGIGAFNLELVYARHRGGVAVPKSKPVYLRDNAIETCYGYWVPENLVEDVDKDLDDAAEGKRQILWDWQNWLSDYRKDIVRAYRTYLIDAKRFLDENEVVWYKYTTADLFQKTKKIERLLTVLVDELDDEDRLKRHSQAWVPMGVPEIWHDIDARADFEDTFFESLSIASTKKNLRGAARLVLKALDLDQVHSSANEIMDVLIDCVKDESWYERNFLVQELAD